MTSSTPRTKQTARITFQASVALLLTVGVGPLRSAPQKDIALNLLGSYASGIYDDGAAETVAHDPGKQWLYVVNSSTLAIDVLDIANPAQPVKLGVISLAQLPPTAFGAPRGLAVHDGLVALSFQADPKTDPGVVVCLTATFDPNLPVTQQITVQDQRVLTVGALPDMITFTPNGRHLLVANEGEPNSYNNVPTNPVSGPSVDPEGSVSIIDLSGGLGGLNQEDVATADFQGFNTPLKRAELLSAGVRLYGPNATVSQDLEPEYITVSHDSRTAWVTLQENNAMATIDIPSRKVGDVIALGHKDHSLLHNGFGSSNALDASDRDGIPVATAGRINIQNWPVKGMFQPDAVAAYQFKGESYLVTANEGDVRGVPGLQTVTSSGSEDIRVGDILYKLDPFVFPNGATLKTLGNLGRLQASRLTGDLDGDGDFDEIHSFGGRSFSIWNAAGDLVFDSGDRFERKLAELRPANFNSNNTANALDARSDDSGPEPECLVLGKAYGRTYAFIGLERIGGIMVYDVTDPGKAAFALYVNNRNFSVLPGAGTIPPNLPTAGDLGAEALVFIKPEDSPTGTPLLVVTNDVSGTTTLFEISKK
jgi:2',3'-cyclic-nucleotide 2'-phosphodiesterase/3'-nucleotidase/5'-nucleotidase